ncbi:hypothetical protein DL96DRAFT_325023 [Flagelloscypha sp. PMI_526]|nr:hypothetical protein DL96DRAFT_325023 [Flagelloscypha sp. PMI_526]
MSTTSQPAALNRGAACSSCRVLKIRCDGQKPVCGPCVQRKHTEDCEWIGVKGKSEAHRLEEQIQALEEKIGQLQTSKKANSTATSKGSGASHSTTTPSQITSSSESETHSDASDGWWNQDEPPLTMRASLIDLFLAQASELGFFLSHQKFRHSALRNKPWGHRSRPTPLLLSAVYLCGIFVSRSLPLKRHEQAVLDRVVKLRNTKSSQHPRQEFHAIQAEILLSRYYVACGKFVESHWSASCALSIASALRLHKIRSTTQEPCRLPPPKDILEEGERIHAFWAVVQNDFGLGAVVDKKPNFMDDAKYGNQADTPWPIPLDDYVYWTDREAGGRTFLNFLGGANQAFYPEDGFEIKLMKTTILIACSHMFSLKVQRPDQFTPEALLREFNHYTPYLTTFFDVYKPNLTPPLTRAEVGLLTRIYGATVFLYNSYAVDLEVSRTNRVEGALKVLRLLTSQVLPHSFINPHYTAPWSLSIKVLCAEIDTLRLEEGGEEKEAEVKKRVDEILEVMEGALEVIQKFEASLPLIGMILPVLHALVDKAKVPGEA